MNKPHCYHWLILKEINPEYSLEGLMLKLKLQYFGCWERLKAGGEGNDRGQDGWMASLTQWTWVWDNPGDGEGQGSLACCSPCGCKESDMTEWWNNNNNSLFGRQFGSFLHYYTNSYDTIFSAISIYPKKLKIDIWVRIYIWKQVRYPSVGE